MELNIGYLQWRTQILQYLIKSGYVHLSKHFLFWKLTNRNFKWFEFIATMNY